MTGDEVVRGRTRERNAALVARRLEERGVVVERVELARDDLPALTGALARMLNEGHDLVVVSGGLGPTHDDLTMEAVARAAGRSLVVHPEALAMVEAASAGIPGDAATRRAIARKQASLPDGARPLPPAGTAPGCVVARGDALVAVLPGPPWELAAMLDEALAGDALAGVLGRARPFEERVLRVHATPESRVVAALSGLDPRAWESVSVGICAQDAELEITVRPRAGAGWAADALEARLASELGHAVYSRDGASLDEVVARLLTDAGATLAVAESCTGGGLGARLTARPGSSAYVLGGVIAYADEAKRAVLGVDPEVIRRHGAVSAECARQMAAGARQVLGSDWALAITGVAGPGGGSPEKPVGLVHVALAGPGVERAEEHRMRGDRERVRERSAAVALHLLRRALEEARAGM